MTTNRRGFLQSSLIVLSLPLSARLHAGRRGENRRLYVVTEARCAATRPFMAMCGIEGEALDADPSRCLSTLEGDLRLRKLDTVFGLTFDSNRFLAEQIALDYGFTREYFGVHDFRRGRARHTLDGHAGFVDVACAALDVDPLAWTEALAASLPVLSRPDATVKRRSLDGLSRRRTDAADYLVSWSLRRA